MKGDNGYKGTHIGEKRKKDKRISKTVSNSAVVVY